MKELEKWMFRAGLRWVYSREDSRKRERREERGFVKNLDFERVDGFRWNKSGWVRVERGSVLRRAMGWEVGCEWRKVEKSREGVILGVVFGGGMMNDFYSALPSVHSGREMMDGCWLKRNPVLVWYRWRKDAMKMLIATFGWITQRIRKGSAIWVQIRIPHVHVEFGWVVSRFGGPSCGVKAKWMGKNRKKDTPDVMKLVRRNRSRMSLHMFDELVKGKRLMSRSKEGVKNWWKNKWVWVCERLF